MTNRNVLNDVRGPELVGPGHHSLVWDVDGRAWLQDPSTGYWLCDFPVASMTWRNLVHCVGPVYALPGVQGGRRPADPMAAAAFLAREAVLRGDRRNPARNVGGRAAS